VPFLGRIPLIGEAFRVRSGKRAQTNLMVFIRPKILADGLQSAVESNAKYNQIRELQRRMNSKVELIPLLPGVPKPELPEATPLPQALPPADSDAAPTTSGGERIITPSPPQ
jgi:general secretion pathway protein D